MSGLMKLRCGESYDYEGLKWAGTANWADLSEGPVSLACETSDTGAANDMVCLWLPLSLGRRGPVCWPQ